MNDQLQSGIRFFLKFVGGMMVKQGYTDDSGWTEFAGGLMAVIGFVWGMCHRSNGKVTPATPMLFLLGCCMAAQVFVYECRRFFAVILFLISIALVLLAPGCMNRPQVTTVNGVSVTNFVKGPDVDLIAGIAGEAAQVGSQFWINGHPNDRPIFVAANESLKVLIDQKNYDPSAFYAALAGLPIKELKTTNGNASLIIQGAVFVFKQGAQHADGVLRQELVAATLSSVQQGIQSALDATAPRSELMDRLRERMDAGWKPAIQPTGSPRYNEVLMPQWRAGLWPGEAYALITSVMATY